MSARDEQLKKEWGARMRPLIGRTIVAVSYQTPGEVEGNGWDRAALVIQLDDDTIMWPSADDEGNGPGAMFMQAGRLTGNLPDGGAPVI